MRLLKVFRKQDTAWQAVDTSSIEVCLTVGAVSSLAHARLVSAQMNRDIHFRLTCLTAVRLFSLLFISSTHCTQVMATYVMSKGPQSMSLLTALRSVFALVAAGVFLPGGLALVDPQDPR